MHANPGQSFPTRKQTTQYGVVEVVTISERISAINETRSTRCGRHLHRAATPGLAYVRQVGSLELVCVRRFHTTDENIDHLTANIAPQNCKQPKKPPETETTAHVEQRAVFPGRYNQPLLCLDRSRVIAATGGLAR